MATEEQNKMTDCPAEKALIVSVFETHGVNMRELLESVKLQPKDFVIRDHQAIFGAMCALYKAGKTLDYITIWGYLRGHNLGNAKLKAYLSDVCMRKTANPESWGTWAQSIKDKSNRRRFLGYWESVKLNAANLDIDFDTFLSGLGDDMRIAANVMADVKPRSWADMFDDWRAGLGNEVRGVKTGIYALDRRILAFSAGDLALVCGRPAMGKTSVLLQFYINACRAGKHCLFFSLEMPEKPIVGRINANLTHTDSRAFKATGDDFTDEIAKKADSVAKFDFMNNGTIISSEFFGPIGVLEIARFVRYYKRAWGSVDAVYIDYLGKMREGVSAKRLGKNVNYSYGSITSDLKELAKSEGVAVILGSQLSRKCEERKDKHPILSDLRDSGEIEQDADTVIGLYRGSYYGDGDIVNGKDDVLEMIILKNREGPTGMIATNYNKEESRIEGVDSAAFANFKRATAAADAQKQEEKAAAESSGKNLFEATPPPDDDDAPQEWPEEDLPF